MVAGVGAAGAAAGAIYAAGLGRGFSSFETWSSFRSWLEAASPRSVFIFLPEEQMTIELLVEVGQWSRERQLSLGLYPLEANLTEACVAAARLVALRLARRTFPHRVALYDSAVQDRCVPDVSLGFGKDGTEAFLGLLREGVDAAFFLVHGTGLDFRLGDVALCTQADDLRPSPAKPGERFIACHVGGRCTREAHGLTSFVGAASIRARFVVMGTCSGILPEDGPFSARLGFARALLRGAHVEAILGSFRTLQVRPEAIRAIARLLEMGYPLGDLAVCMNEVSPGAIGFLCLGDPESSLSPDPSLSAHEPEQDEAPEAEDVPAPTSDPPPPSPVTRGASELLFQADTLHLMAANEPSPEMVAARSIEDRLRWMAVSLFSRNHWLESLAAFDWPLARLYAAWARTRGALDWPRTCTPEPGGDGGACPACNNPTQALRYHSRLYPTCGREVSRCPEHGIITDRPLGWPLPAATAGWIPGASQPAIQVLYAGGPPQLRGAVVAVLERHAEGVMGAAPVLETGEARVDLRVALEPGPSARWISVVHAAGGTCAWLRAPLAPPPQERVSCLTPAI